MTDLQAIHQIEEELNIKLEKVNEIDWKTKGYTTDNDSNINGLGLYDCKIKDLNRIANGLRKFKNLTILNLSANKIANISILREFKRLTKLDFSDNLVPEISSLKELKKLTDIAFSYNLISNISFLSNLENLTRLDLSYNHITDISDLQGLSKITNLNLGGNLISNYSFLKYFKKLKILHLYNTKRTDYSFLSELKNLTKLDIRNNNIKDISFLEKLHQIWYLNLENNKIHELPYKVFKSLSIINNWNVILKNNPIERPPFEIVKQGNEAIGNYFKSIIGKKRPLNELKLIFVGEGSAGKTSLMKRIMGKKFDKNEKQTHGINIADKKFKLENQINLKVNMWDFGGQEIMHSTHQFFLSKRSLYILVLDGRKDEKTEYWLKHIENFGLDSPVIVVLNKYDEHKGAELNRKFLQEKYKSIKAFAHISCLSGYGFDDFNKLLIYELSLVKAAQTMWGENWFRVKSELEKETDDYISIDKFTKVCERNIIQERSEQETLLAFLHDLGVMLHFKDLPLHDTNVLNPKWLTNAVYRIINSKKVKDNNGELKVNDLDEILVPSKEESNSFMFFFNKNKNFEYPRSKYNYIIEVMKKFELCYNIGNNTWLLPSLLPIQEPDFEINENIETLHFIFEYDFFPKSIMPRIIVKSHEDIKDKIRWRTGVVLESINYDATASIISDEEDKKISVEVRGVQKRDYFAIIRNTIKNINNSFKRLEVAELIPLPGYPENMVEYEELIGYEQANIENYFNGKLRKAFSVKELLDGVVSQQQRKREQHVRAGNTYNTINVHGSDNIIGQDVDSKDFTVSKE
jgi:hypothetical protein